MEIVNSRYTGTFLTLDSKLRQKQSERAESTEPKHRVRFWDYNIAPSSPSQHPSSPLPPPENKSL